ncbi:Tetratricopeptide repeat protein 1 [Neolecta irregularis DAH-3]|uniref:Tetratricopeptide repeat protein 1 n=1 Tax=Neolecta irregularis (strain DAH-3) TaxID=1198029 RepID=A0A1U7LWE0_NEOID|nr:Tetratricopeptide repeat protein 1 [Neolecta irregularis DAH-3]|eukprot:OLL26995.1 Tetratricopeptide repeat protein 1 [Neolecta irregularis DAH-3]
MNDLNTNDDKIEPAREMDVFINANPKQPRIIEVPLKGTTDQFLEIDCAALPEDCTELSEALEAEEAEKAFWTRLAFEYNRQGMVDQAIELLLKGLEARAVASDQSNKLTLHAMLASLYIQKSRSAPRTAHKDELVAEAKTKDVFIRLAQDHHSSAIRIDRDWGLNQMEQAILALGKIGSGKADNDKLSLDQAAKLFEDVLKHKDGNLIALMGKARILYAKSNYKAALRIYQRVMQSQPDFQPDPRIGIGMCFWQLKWREDARAAWERSLELNPECPTSLMLLGIYYLEKSYRSVNDTTLFIQTYQKAMQFVSQARKRNTTIPMAGVVLAGYLFMKKETAKVFKLAEQVMSYSSLASITSEAFYWMARCHHHTGNMQQAINYYRRAKELNPDSLLASIGIGQMQLITRDWPSATLTFEKLAQNSPRCMEVHTILGAIYDRNSRDPTFKSDKKHDRIRARNSYDRAAKFFDDLPNQPFEDHLNIFLARSRLLEDENLDSSLNALEQVSKLYQDNDTPVTPEILNNMGVLNYEKGRYDHARVFYQDGLTLCVTLKNQDASKDLDALITTLTYNLGRLEEQSGNLDAARSAFTNILSRHPDYVEARVRLCMLDMHKEPLEVIARTVKQIYEGDPDNLDVRALHGWCLSKGKRAEEFETKHYTHTLRHFDRHDIYSLTAMGNVHLRQAKEMRITSEPEKEKRKKLYERAVEFFEKALQLDNKNAYAAQGVAIALAEEKKFDKAIQILMKVRETVNDPSVHLNLGHCLAETKEYSRAIESFTNAAKLSSGDKQKEVWACQGHVWAHMGKTQNSSEAFKMALKYNKMLLGLSPDNAYHRYNLAYLHNEYAQTLLRKPAGPDRPVESLEAALVDLDTAIEIFGELLKSSHPPHPTQVIQQRMNMCKNTLKGRLERAIIEQQEYETASLARRDEATRKREAEQRKREEKEVALRQEQEERNRVIAEERREMQEQLKAIAERRKQEEDEQHSGSDTEKKPKRKKRSKKDASSIDRTDVTGDVSDGDEEIPSKKRKMVSKKQLSKARIDDSDDDMADVEPSEVQPSAEQSDTEVGGDDDLFGENE